jgi:two-component system sensor histidine kinase YesM
MRQYQTLNDDNVSSMRCLYSTSTAYDRYVMTSAAMKKMTELGNSSQYVISAKLYIKNINKAITKNRIEDIDYNELNNIIEAENSSNGIIISYKGRLIMVDSLLSNYTINKLSPENVDSLLVVDLDKSIISAYLRYAELTPQDIMVLVNRSDKRLIASTELPKENIESHLDYGSSIKIAGKQYNMVKAGSDRLNADIYWLYIDDLNSNLMKKNAYIIYAFFATIFLAIVFSVLLFYKSIYKPLKVLLEDAFQQVRDGNFKYRIEATKSGIFADLYLCFNNMVNHIDTLIEKDLKHQLLISRANLKQLQAQINPHFMYNSYYVLYRLIKMKDYDNSMVMSENLGKFFKYITRDSDYEKPLSEEVEHARMYTLIQSFRFKNMLEIDFMDLPKEYANIPVPRLIIQPIIENAFKYVFDNVPADGKAILRITFTQQDEWLNICIENSGSIESVILENIRRRIYSQGENDEVTALSNINRRLNIYFKTDQSINVTRSVLGGLEVHILIKM